MSCDGYLRLSEGQIYSAPIASSVSNVTCSSEFVQSYLWSTKIGATAPTVECKEALPMNMTRQFQGKSYCFGAPSPSNGWPVPALVDCSALPAQVTRVRYHPFSGQIRSGGMCLTAVPYSISTNKSCGCNALVRETGWSSVGT
jgi:hypothetical protein